MVTSIDCLFEEQKFHSTNKRKLKTNSHENVIILRWCLLLFFRLKENEGRLQTEDEEKQKFHANEEKNLHRICSNQTVLVAK